MGLHPSSKNDGGTSLLVSELPLKADVCWRVCFIIRHLRNEVYFLKGPGLNGQIQRFLETMNCYAGTSEQNGHMKEISKAATYGYSQWKLRSFSFLSLPWK